MHNIENNESNNKNELIALIIEGSHNIEKIMY